MGKYKIDEAAKESGLTKRTIRYYEEIGLLPSPERTEGGMRLYTRAHIDRLTQIASARDVLGFSLQEIMEFVTIREQMDGHRHAYSQSVEEDLRQRELSQIERTLGKQLQMINRKLAKMAEFRKEIARIHQRVRNTIGNHQPQKEQN